MLDVACGGGDLSRRLARRAQRAGLRLQFDGCDISATAVEHAKEMADREGGSSCHFFVHDALNQPFPESYDVLTCTLFLHHLQDSQVVTLLRNMARAARRAIRADDLVRSQTGYWLAQIGCRILSQSPIVHYDGPVSVKGAYTIEEARELAAQAGLSGASFQKHWPERFLMTWQKGG